MTSTGLGVEPAEYVQAGSLTKEEKPERCKKKDGETAASLRVRELGYLPGGNMIWSNDRKYVVRDYMVRPT